MQFALELSKSPGHSSLLAKIQRLLEALMIETRSSDRMAKMGNSCVGYAWLAIFLPPAGQEISISATALWHDAGAGTAFEPICGLEEMR
jgi:hypothetical protein